MKDVMSGIDAVGYQVMERADPLKNRVISNLVRLVNPTSLPGITGLFTEDDLDSVNEHAKKRVYSAFWAVVGKRLNNWNSPYPSE
ncbi:hypothetical protein [Methanosarcina vacuolata]|uniref:Uncharacterized protein n=1 Tax=Methanosarcina vacuolata Z-761 TaxID=1434123 RepID=A0A0E3Q584_9EURY|nr:hypothetical protein [Methanosarcina vacuolata]AKB43925.1 hypothetical protein MSVAZ_1656 [Methanosarcina vacuolata Z-761]